MLGRKKYRARPKAAHDLEKSHPLQLWITIYEGISIVDHYEGIDRKSNRWKYLPLKVTESE